MVAINVSEVVVIAEVMGGFLGLVVTNAARDIVRCRVVEKGLKGRLLDPWAGLTALHKSASRTVLVSVLI